MDPKELAIKIAVILDSKKALDVRVMGVNELTSLGDYFVVCEATNSTQVKALADEVDFQIGKLGQNPLRTEGYQSAGWVLLDYGDVIVHVFLNEARQFFNLERLWGDAVMIDLPFEHQPGIISQEKH